jgi:hypothetical protein
MPHLWVTDTNFITDPALALTMMARVWALRARRASVTSGGISFVNSATGYDVSGTNITLSLSGLGLAQDDIVIVGSVQDFDVSPIGSVSGYTQLASINVSGNNFIWVGYKKMAASPDASAVVTGTGSSAFGMSAVAMIFRGVNATTPIDVTTTTASGSSTNPNPPAITPANNNCAIVIMGGSVDDSSPGSIASYSTPVVATSVGATFNTSFAGCYQLLSGGASVAQDPAAFSSWSTGAWGVATIALRPA